MVTERRKTLKLACKDSCSLGKALESTHETLFCSASPAIFNNFTANGDIFHHIRARGKRGHPKCLLQLKLKIIYCSQKKRSLQKALERLFMMISSGWKHLHIHFDGVLFALERRGAFSNLNEPGRQKRAPEAVKACDA